ncbi:hypothetical protein T439DRAFT_165014 [Meredithblackwellia eburnea MCA 4105]
MILEHNHPPLDPESMGPWKRPILKKDQNSVRIEVDPEPRGEEDSFVGKAGIKAKRRFHKGVNSDHEGSPPPKRIATSYPSQRVSSTSRPKMTNSPISTNHPKQSKPQAPNELSEIGLETLLTNMSPWLIDHASNLHRNGINSSRAFASFVCMEDRKPMRVFLKQCGLSKEIRTLFLNLATTLRRSA